MLEQRGAMIVATPRKLASRADIILSSVAVDAEQMAGM
jgi:3-hydroxyisobutyrate dehydrogenase-like beta-hydroxyacid dehydrogenase